MQFKSGCLLNQYRWGFRVWLTTIQLISAHSSLGCSDCMFECLRVCPARLSCSRALPLQLMSLRRAPAARGASGAGGPGCAASWGIGGSTRRPRAGARPLPPAGPCGSRTPGCRSRSCMRSTTRSPLRASPPGRPPPRPSLHDTRVRHTSKSTTERAVRVAVGVGALCDRCCCGVPFTQAAGFVHACWPPTELLGIAKTEFQWRALMPPTIYAHYVVKQGRQTGGGNSGFFDRNPR